MTGEAEAKKAGTGSPWQWPGRKGRFIVVAASVLLGAMGMPGHASAQSAQSAQSAGWPEQKEGDFVLRDFRFRSGEVMPELRLHYTTIGKQDGEPVLILHGTAQSGKALLNPAFAGELFGPGQPLDATKYYLILPDAIGHGRSSKPSDGMRAAFPHYDYDDMVAAQYRLVTEHLGVRHLRMIIGNSMGGMETWLFAQGWPDLMDIAVPMASMPTPMAGRNWMLRRLITDSIRRDPDWNGGNYTRPLKIAQFASVFFGLATSGGNQALAAAAPTRARADALVDERLAAPFAADANDVLYQWDSSRNYDPSAGLERIEATLLAINSADDERNPLESGVLDREIRRLPRGKVFVIPGSEQTSGHGTTGQARFWKGRVEALLRDAPRREPASRPTP